MPRPLPYLPETASQTAGPYVHIGLAPAAAGLEIFGKVLGADIAGPNAAGERIRIEGLIHDGTGSPIRDAMIEIWQANAAGIYPHPEDPRAAEVEPGFRGWGRAITDFTTGVWSVETIKPGPVPGRNGTTQAPHLSLWIVARGINIGLSTRLYFADEAEANAADPVLNAIEQAPRRSTLLATREVGAGLPVYRFDIRLQGEGETVFFDL
jgi:protocatechuate 3,4-dioxygenase alpha subunit